MPRHSLEDLQAIMAALRAENGCPWDRKQTLHSLRTYLLEEAHEVLEAIDQGEADHLCEELGDLLFQIVFQSQIASEEGWFDLKDVIHGIASKIKRRHPHVFQGAPIDSADEVARRWEDIKRSERPAADAAQAGPRGALDGVPRSLPALLLAHKLSDRAARVGFDWENPVQVLEKVEEEIAELKEALAGAQADPQHVAWELGDLLFALSNLARHLTFSAEDCLREACLRFSSRFGEVERLARQRGIEMHLAGITVLEELWQEAKKNLSC